jgi:hypothetical protein
MMSNGAFVRLSLKTLRESAIEIESGLDGELLEP